MLNYAICEIGGKQYKVMSGKAFEIDFQGNLDKHLTVNVLLLSEDDKFRLGNPYLKDKLTLEVLGDTKRKKIRVAKFHAKANYRKVVGIRNKLTKVILPVKKLLDPSDLLRVNTE